MTSVAQCQPKVMKSVANACYTLSMEPTVQLKCNAASTRETRTSDT